MEEVIHRILTKLHWKRLLLLLVLVWKKYCQNCYYKNTYKHKHILETYFSFLLVSRPGVRTKIIETLMGIHAHILRVTQHIKIKSNCHGILNRQELRLYQMKSKKNVISLLTLEFISFVLFSIDLFL